MIKRLVLLITLGFLASCSMMKGLGKIEGVKPKIDPLHVSWAKNLDPKHNTGNLPVALQSPFIYEGLVYIGTAKHTMNAYSAADGRLIWSEKTTGGFHAGASVYKEQIIYGTVEGRVSSRHYLTGELQYEVDLGAPVESRAVVYRDRLFFQTRNHKIYCLDAITGKIIWAYKRSVPFLTTIQRVSKPFVEKNKLYVGFADGSITAFNIEDGVILWERKISTGSKFVDVDISPLKVGKRLYAGAVTGGLTQLNASTGAIHRTFPYTISRKPILLGDNLLFGTIDGDLVLMDKYGKEILKKKVSNSAITSLKKWKESFIVGTASGELVLMNPDTYEVEAKKHLGNTFSAVFGDIVVQGDLMAVMSSRNRLYIFQ